MPQKLVTKEVCDIKTDRLNTQLEEIKAELLNIKDNHLKHLEDKINGVELKIAYWSGGIAVILIVFNLILKFV